MPEPQTPHLMSFVKANSLPSVRWMLSRFSLAWTRSKSSFEMSGSAIGVEPTARLTVGADFGCALEGLSRTEGPGVQGEVGELEDNPLFHSVITTDVDGLDRLAYSGNTLVRIISLHYGE